MSEDEIGFLPSPPSSEWTSASSSDGDDFAVPVGAAGGRAVTRVWLLGTVCGTHTRCEQGFPKAFVMPMKTFSLQRGKGEQRRKESTA